MGAADRKPLVNSEKRADVYYSKGRMLKESLACPTLCSIWYHQNTSKYPKTFISVQVSHSAPTVGLLNKHIHP